MPEFDRYTWFGLFAPAGTPRGIIARLQSETVAALKADDVLEAVRLGRRRAGRQHAGAVHRADPVRCRRVGRVIRAANVEPQ